MGSVFLLKLSNVQTIRCESVLQKDWPISTGNLAMALIFPSRNYCGARAGSEMSTFRSIITVQGVEPFHDEGRHQSCDLDNNDHASMVSLLKTPLSRLNSTKNCER